VSDKKKDHPCDPLKGNNKQRNFNYRKGISPSSSPPKGGGGSPRVRRGEERGPCQKKRVRHARNLKGLLPNEGKTRFAVS